MVAPCNYLLSSLPPETLARLQRDVRLVSLPPGTVLHEAGEAMTHVYFPVCGVVSFLTNFQSGHVIDFAIVGCEGLVGGMAALGMPASPYRVTVQIPGSALAMPIPAFMAMVAEDPGFRDVVGRFQAALLVQAYHLAACNALHRVEARLCRWLLQLSDRTQSHVLPLTQEFIAQMLGVQRTTVTLVEQHLKAANLVRHRRGRIELLDEAGLRRSACECYDHMKNAYDGVFPSAAARAASAASHQLGVMAQM